jgi:hypothetical protein
MAIRAVVAVYGGLKGGGENNTQAAIVTDALQAQFQQNPNGVVKISNETMGGDPAIGTRKHFGALVDVDGVTRPFACEENQTIDFS